MNLLKKKKKIGAFHNDLHTLTAKKSINLKSYEDKAVDTNELNEYFRNEVTT